MLYPKNKEKTLNEELFLNPTSEYRCTPFWAWNCDLKKEDLFKEIEFMKEMGMGGFHMHTRVRMSTKYLSDEFMNLIRSCADEAEKKNMLAWLYDEDKWPSGYAGGYVTKNPENRQKYLMITSVPYEEYKKNNSFVDASAKVKRNNKGVLCARYLVELDSEGYLKNYKRLADFEKPEGRIWYAYMETAEPTPWFNFETYSDNLSKKTVEDFISITHEKYKEYVGDKFQKTIPAIFTDEPQITHQTELKSSFDNEDIILPFTTDFEKTYTETYGESILDKLPEVLWEKRGTPSVTRYRYHDHVTERFVSAYCDTVGNWCKENGLLFTGHVMNENSLYSQTGAVGECMRTYRSFGMPGVDMLCDDREFTTVKQAASAAHQYGCPGVLSELYGVTNWDFDFRGHKLQGDWQAALGVSVRVPHLYWVSMKGEAKRDYPASIGHQSAWYKEYSFIEDHFARVNTLMTRGTPDIKIGVIHPIHSYWLHYGPDDLTADIRDNMDEHFENLTKWLLFDTLDFDFICESLLPDQYSGSDGGFKVGKMKYDVVVVPDAETLKSTTVKALEEFAESGGQVIFVGKIPSLVDALPSTKGEELAKKCRYIGWDRYALTEMLEPFRTVKIRNTIKTRTSAGRIIHNLFYAMRDDNGGKNLFICHANPAVRDGVDKKEDYEITVKGTYKVKLMDTLTGEISYMPVKYFGGNTIINWECYAHSSLLLRLEDGMNEIQSDSDKEEKETSKGKATEYLKQPDEIILSEPNVCVLDMARFKIDDGDWHEREEGLRIEVKAKNLLNLSTGATKGAQPWILEKEEYDHTITLLYTFVSDIEVESAQLALEDSQESSVIFNGREINMDPVGYYVDFSIKKINIGKINIGENTVIIKKPFGVASNTENVFILGNFGVDVVGTDVTITSPGNKLLFGDWTRQKLAFYGGRVTYRFNIEGGRNVDLRLGLFAAPCITAELDGKKIANISLAPYEAKLGKLSEGNHVLDINVYASRVNTFGAFHFCNGFDDWAGPTMWRTEGEDYDYGYHLKESGLLTAPRLFFY